MNRNVIALPFLLLACGPIPCPDGSLAQETTQRLSGTWIVSDYSPDAGIDCMARCKQLLEGTHYNLDGCSFEVAPNDGLDAGAEVSCAYSQQAYVCPPSSGF